MFEFGDEPPPEKEYLCKVIKPKTTEETIKFYGYDKFFTQSRSAQMRLNHDRQMMKLRAETKEKN